MADLFKLTKCFIHKTLFKLCGMIHPIERKIVCSSFFGKQYSDNPKAISEKMHELYPDYEIVWLIDKSRDKYKYIPDYVRTVVKGERPFAWGREITTCVAYIINVEFKSNIYKKRKQLFIQTWHGDRAIKKILLEQDKDADVYDNMVTDICIAGSDAGEDLYRVAFRYEGKVLKEGCPRNDILLNDNYSQRMIIRERIGVEPKRKILLYAPTFRDNNMLDKQSANIDFERVLSLLERNGEHWCCLIRAHVASAGININCDGKRYIDVTEYPDMADILSVTDFLLTDFSSSATDFSITGKPVVLILFDEKEYQNSCRDFKVQPEKLGFYYAYNQNELDDIIATKCSEDYRIACDKVNSFYGICESGESSKIVCEYINNHYMNSFLKH